MHTRFNDSNFKWLVIACGLALGISQGCSTPRTEPATASGGADSRNGGEQQLQGRNGSLLSAWAVRAS